MKTTCPYCNTAFRVHEAQLEQHGGDVRCGRCGEVFNGYEFLDGGEGLAAPPQQGVSTRQEVAAAPAEVEPDALAESAPEASQSEAPLAGEAEPAPDEQVEPESPRAVETSPEEPAENLSPGPESPATSDVTETDAAGPDDAKPAAETPSRRWLWVTGSLLALAGLAVQGALHYRMELSLAQPGLRPVLEQLCAMAGCGIGLPRQPDMLSIESSELQADPARVETITLVANLRNRSRHAMTYPLLELTLTDSQDRMLARQVFRVGEYHPSADAKAGFAPGSDIQVRLPMQLKELRPVGYRLYLYYPQE